MLLEKVNVPFRMGKFEPWHLEKKLKCCYLLTESHVVEHIKGVELEIVSDKLVADTKTEFKNLHTHKLELSYEAAEALYIKLGQRLKTAQ